MVKPSPPNNIRVNMIPCPKELQYVAVSSTVRPVTVTAEVEVKKATSRGVNPPLLLAIGRARSRPPNIMRTPKL